MHANCISIIFFSHILSKRGSSLNLPSKLINVFGAVVRVVMLLAWWRSKKEEEIDSCLDNGRKGRVLEEWGSTPN